jgi:hypothetical protein
MYKEETMLKFDSYSEYSDFMSSHNSELEFSKDDFDGFLKEALIDAGNTPREARNFLRHWFDVSYIKEIRYYDNDRIAFEARDVEFIESEYAENDITGFVLLYYVEDNSWRMGDMING